MRVRAADDAADKHTGEVTIGAKVRPPGNLLDTVRSDGPGADDAVAAALGALCCSVELFFFTHDYSPRSSAAAFVTAVMILS